MSSEEQTTTSSTTLPEDVLIILPVRNVVLFPGVVLPVTVARRRTVAGAQEAVRSRRKVGFLLQLDPQQDDPGPKDLHTVGTLANVVRFVTAQDGTHHLICQGEQRFRVLDYVSEEPFLVARIELLREPEKLGPEIEARAVQLRERALEAVSLLPQAPGELANAIQGIDSPSALADVVASFMDLKPADKQQILATVDVKERLDRVLLLLTQRIEVLRISKEIGEKTREALDERQKEAILREQLRQIRRELGEDEGSSAEIEELRAAVEKAGMPPEVEEHVRREISRLERMPEASAEYSMARTYIDWLLAMPWSKLDAEDHDIEKARRILDEDHYGLEKIKRRILEFLAVRKLNPEGRSPILCFVGPPGVGKTSLGQSIARALGLKFARVSLGGVHDEAEIRGHRRTYIGALPGNIVQAIRKAGTRNPVLMLDEVDKLSASIQGDPASALLEVLDPEQNNTFRDNYLGVPFDLSRVLFICTANVLDAIPAPLRDRMEIIELTGYTEEEKLQIALRYLVKRQLAQNGLRPEHVTLGEDVIRRIITDYTREAGVRNLERQIGAVLRWVAVAIAEGRETSVTVTPDDLPRILGAPRFENEVAMRTSVPGVATGLAWTPVGGDILFIESSRVPGSGKLILTGHLGDVMKESAQAALTLVKGQAERLGIDPSVFEKSDLHVHVPAGAIPKDGPSAGVAMFVSLASLLSGRTVRSDVAMTGEISLRGLVLPVGGIKEKTVAAARAGLRRVILPARNRRDFEDIPESARRSLEFVWAERIEDVLNAALEESPLRREAA
ncbi:MAG: endopeptidase La [Pseudomonadota bacterium]|jgi:ATP-dependent protease La|nr:MAG: endopeptidase La [Pseudomonadota bacterium]